MNNARRYRAGVGLAVVAVVGLPGAIHAGVDSAHRLALTLSGLPAAPYGQRSVRVGESGVAVRFEAPTTADLASVALFWARPGAGCTLILHRDDAGPAEAVASGEIPEAAGWVSVQLAASLVSGTAYHLAVRCPPPTRARLAYVLDAEHGAVTGGIWQLEDLRRGGRARGAPTTPLFALTFADGTSWGQPYRPGRRAGTIAIGGLHQASALVVAGKPLVVTGVDVPLRDPGGPDALDYMVSTPGGPPLRGNALPAADPAGLVFQPSPLARPLTLEPGTTYLVRLAAPGAGPRGLRLRPLRSDVALGPPLSGLQSIGMQTSDDGGLTWRDADAGTLDAAFLLLAAPARGTTCGNGVADPGEGCDGAADAACPGRCTGACACAAIPPGGATGDPVPPPSDAYRSIYAAGFLGAYDHDGPTVSQWPRKLGLIEVDATNNGARVAGYKQASAAAGNSAARYWFYSSLTSIDAKCGCRDQRMYEAFTRHEEFWLHDAGGHRISTFVASLGTGRQIATDVGNPAFADAWADYQLATMEREGWDGVWADNVICAWDVGVNWSAAPVNPRTGAPYQLADYRRDLAAALARIHDRLAAAGKLILGNHGGSCVAEFFADASVRDQLLNMDGSAIENCVFDFWDSGCGCNRPLAERTYVDQLRYLSFANRSGKQTECILQHGGVTAAHRAYGLASYLLTKEGLSSIGELNQVGDYWTGPPGGTHGLDTDLGPAAGEFYCLDPADGFARQENGSAGCPGTGKLYGRDFAAGRVLANPTSNAYTIDLGGGWVCDGSSVARVSLPAKSGAVCNR